MVRQFAVAAVASFALIAFAGSSALAQQAEAMKYCKSDVARLCPGVRMGGGRIIACLKEHKMEVSVGCAKAIQAMKGKMGK
jgi:Cysteine rich repeat